jgi:HSP20 family protein
MPSFLEKLKKGAGIEKQSVKEPESESFSAQPNFVIQKIEESSADLETKSKKAKRPYPEQSRKVKVEGELIKPKSEGSQELPEKPKLKEKKWFEPEGQLTIDVYQTDGELVIQAPIAGVLPEELDISSQGDVVIIRGRRERPAGDEQRNYFYQECYWGLFSREIILPTEADPSRAKAAMEEGILTIRMPKIEKEKEKKIVVKK